jgi:tRNA A37 threonylcarbamoyltransferase TsaD
MKIHCVGASYPLKQRATRVFYNSSVPEAVEVIAKEFENAVIDVLVAKTLSAVKKYKVKF